MTVPLFETHLPAALNPCVVLARFPHRSVTSHPNTTQRQDCAAPRPFRPSFSIRLLRHIQQLPTINIITYVLTPFHRPPPASFRSEEHVGRFPRHPAASCRPAGRVLYPWERNDEFGSIVGELGWAGRECRFTWTKFRWGDSRGCGRPHRCSWAEVVAGQVGESETEVLGGLGEGGEGTGEGSGGSFFSSEKSRTLLLTIRYAYRRRWTRSLTNMSLPFQRQSVTSWRG